jgi:glycosyltransferase involved in cell wall biosynthesis
MRVLILHNRYQLPGGEDTVVAQESQMLRERGHEVEILEENNDDIRGFRAQLQTAVVSIYSKKSYEVVRFRINQVRPDVVHVHNLFPKLTPAVYAACNDANVPVIQTLHNFRIICPGTILYRNGQICQDCVGRSIAWPGVMRGCYRGSCAGTAAVAVGTAFHHLRGTWKNGVSQYIALTEFSRSQFVAGGLPAEKITVKPNSVNDPGVGAHDGKFLLFVGRLTPEKGVRLLLQAASQNLLPLPLKMVGTGPLTQEVAPLAAAGKVEWLEQCSRADVLRLMKEATALVFPSQWFEGMPMVLLEALATGLPVVASNLGSMPEMIQHQQTGLLFAPGNVREMMNQTARLVSDQDLLEKIQQNARAEFLKKFEPEANTRHLLQIYQQAITVDPGASMQEPVYV